MGLTSYVTDPKTSLPYDQRDACTVFESFDSMGSKVVQEYKDVNDTEWYDNVAKGGSQRSLVSKYPIVNNNCLFWGRL